MTAVLTLWHDFAACKGRRTRMFFPESGQVGVAQTLAAKRVCATCQVREECLAAALAQGERYGVWGGLTYNERRGISHWRSCAECGERFWYHARTGYPIRFCSSGCRREARARVVAESHRRSDG